MIIIQIPPHSYDNQQLHFIDKVKEIIRLSNDSRSDLLYKLKEEIGEYPVYKSCLNILLNKNVFDIESINIIQNHYERVLNYSLQDFSQKKNRIDLLTIFANIVKFE